MRSLASAVMLIALVAGGCGGGGSSDQKPLAVTPSTGPRAQAVLDRASKVLKDKQSGGFSVEIVSFPGTTHTEGKYDLSVPFSEMTTTAPVFGMESSDVTDISVHALVFDKVTYVHVSEGPSSKCWYVFKAGGKVSRVNRVIVPKPIPPAVQVSFQPKALGFVGHGEGHIRATVPLVDAVEVAFPNLTLSASKPIPATATVAVDFSVYDDSYEGLSFGAGDLVEAARKVGVELLHGTRLPGRTAEQTENEFARLKIDVAYKGLGQYVRVHEPDAGDLVATVDKNGDIPPLCTSARGA